MQCRILLGCCRHFDQWMQRVSQRAAPTVRSVLHSYIVRTLDRTSAMQTSLPSYYGSSESFAAASWLVPDRELNRSQTPAPSQSSMHAAIGSPGGGGKRSALHEGRPAQGHRHWASWPLGWGTGSTVAGEVVGAGEWQPRPLMSTCATERNSECTQYSAWAHPADSHTLSWRSTTHDE